VSDLENIVRFYRDGLGFAELGHRFENHTGAQIVQLGLQGAPCYLELTKTGGIGSRDAQSTVVALVVRLSSESEWNDAAARMKKFGYEAVSSSHPFCDQHELTFVDPAGHRIILRHADWEC
jgi:hypothetical protein